MIAPWILLAALGGTTAQEAESDPERLFAEALARTTTLTEFRAIYRFEHSAQPTAQLELVYRARSEARVGVVGEESSVRTWLVGDSMHMRRFEGGKLTAWGSFDAVQLLDDPVWEVFGQEFPIAGERLPSGAVFHVHLELDPDKPPTFDFNLGVQTGRRAPVCWGQLERELPTPTLHDGVLVFGQGDTTLEVSAETGFLALAHGVGEGELTVTLESLQLGEGVTDEDFVVPAPTDEAEDISSQLAGMLSSLLTGPRQRARVFEALGALLEDQRVTWNDEARGKLTRVLRTFHERAAQARYGSWAERARERTRTIAEEVRKHLGTGGEPADVDLELARQRTDLESRLQAMREAYLSSLASAEISFEGDRGWIEDALELEAQVADAVMLETFTGPLLAYFDEQIAAARE